MSKLMGWLFATVLALGIAGCATSGGSSGPCSSCKHGVSTKKADFVEWNCMVDGKQVDCKTNPGACPGCKK